MDEILKQPDRDAVELEDQMALYREACGDIGRTLSIFEETRAEIKFLMDGSGGNSTGEGKHRVE